MFHSDQFGELAASFIPSLLRREFGLNPRRNMGSERIGEYAALLWVDICEFSPMANRLMQDRLRGVERLSHILQDHYEQLLTTISLFGGEPISFAGDSVLAAWPCSAEHLPEATKIASACAQAILAEKAVYDDLGKPLVFHLIVAAGTCQLFELGGINGQWTFTLLGEAMSDLRLTARNRAPNEVLLSKNALVKLGSVIRSRAVAHESAILVDLVQVIQPFIGQPPPLLPETFESLKAYIPPSVAIRLDQERLKWIAELRPVTIVFVQLLDFAAETSNAAERLQQTVEIAMTIVLRHDGLLTQIWVDEKAANLLICFGPPPAEHADNPARGLRTASNLQITLHKAGFRNSIGVATGRGFCGLVGNNLLRQYTVIGDVVNLAARLAALSNDCVYCDDATRKGALNAFDFKDPQYVTVKGKDGQIAIWEPQPITTNRKNIQLLPMIGRQKELALLTDARQATQAGDHVAFIVEGPSGSGKSRLLTEFRNRTNASQYRILSSAGDQVERGVLYQAWRSIFSDLLGINASDDTLDKQHTVLNVIGVENADRACLLNILLPLDFPESESVRALSSQQRSTATHEFLVQLVGQSAATGPMAILIDDAHWMDTASWALATDIFNQVPACLLICTVLSYDGSQDAKQLLKAGAIQLRLTTFSDNELDQLISDKLGVSHTPAEVTSLIRSLVKGNVLFCLELTQSLLDEKTVLVNDGVCTLTPGISTGHLQLPETIQGVVRRRIDSLSPGPELALKVASVAGQRFAIPLIQHIYPIYRERELVPIYLKEDNMVGLLIDDLVDSVNGYTFNNSITRDVAYDMMLFEQRQHLHLDTASWLEQTFRENLTPHFARLAYHWEGAGNYEKAADYLEKEAIRSFSAGYARQSIDFGLRGVALFGIRLERTPAEIGPRIGENMAAIGALLAGRSAADLVRLKPLDDPHIERVLSLLLRNAPFAHQSQQIELYALITITGLRITLENGNGLAAPDVYSLYSVIHSALTGDRPTAVSWSQLAMDLSRPKGGAVYCRAAFVHAWFHNHWIHPLSQSLPLSLAGADVGFASGEILFACFNLSAYVVHLAAIGRPLQEVMDAARSHSLLNGRRVFNAAFHLVHELQVAKALAGLTSSLTSLTDDEYDETQDLASFCDTELANQIGYYFISKVKLHTHIGDWQGALAWAARAMPYLSAVAGQTGEIDLVQFQGLALLTGAMESSGDTALNLLTESEAAIHTLRSWTKNCPANFEHKALLLEAVRAGVVGRADEADSLFEQAANLAQTAGFSNDVALAYEYRLHMQHRANKPHTALEMAIKSYRAWGAEGKVAYLMSRYTTH